MSDLPNPPEANTHYVSNRQPLLPSPLVKLPIGSITPSGWLLTQLRNEAQGMIGHMSELSAFLQSASGWQNPENVGWEEMPYWLKGYGDLGYVLKDQRIIQEAWRWLEPSLRTQEPDGYFGPRPNKRNRDAWPNMVMLFAYQSRYEALGDESIIPFMTRYFKYQWELPEADFMPESWQKTRGGDNLESVYWLYNRTGEPFLLELAHKVFRHTDDWTSGVVSHHGVNICMGVRQPGVYFQQTKDPKHLDAVERNYHTVMDEYGQVPGGMFGADENYQPGHVDPNQGAETCSMVEFMYSFESLLKITGDPKYADRIEDIAFNSLPCSVSPDFRGLHYVTAPNCVQLDKSAQHVFQNEWPMLQFDPFDFRCCQHNVAMGWPYYAEHLWMATRGNGLAAVLYAPCRVTATVGDGTEVTLAEKTNYPFGEEVEFVLHSTQPVAFPLSLRIPAWAHKAEITVNDKSIHVPAVPGDYAVIERTWHDGDRVVLHLHMKINLTTWTRNQNSVSVNRGPLTYSLRIGQKWVRTPGSANSNEWPAFEVFPTTHWNYGLVLDPRNPADSFSVRVKTQPLAEQPFNLKDAPIEIRAKGKLIPEWGIERNTVGNLRPSPVKSEEPVEDIALIPMGCAHLRLSAFPVIGEGPDAHEWGK